MSLTSAQALELFRTTTKPLTGQHIPEWQPAQTSLNQYVAPLQDKPAILSIEWKVGAADDIANNASHTQAAIDHLNAGGIVFIAPHFPSPFGTDQTLSSAWGTKGDHAQLLANAPSSTAKARWQGNIDRLNALLDKLPQNAAVVLHPFHEGNGSWFWWGYNSANPSRSSIGLANLYNDTMNRVHALQRGLIRGFQAGMTWYANVGHGFPGLGNVDVVGSSMYRTTDVPLTFVNKFQDDYTALKNYGLPILIFEGGPQPDTAPLVTSGWDAHQMGYKLLDRYPEIKSTLMWHIDNRGFGPWSSFTNGPAAFAHDRLATLQDIQQAAPEPSEKTVYTALRNPVVGVYTSEDAAWAAGDDIIAVVQSEVQE